MPSVLRFAGRRRKTRSRKWPAIDIARNAPCELCRVNGVPSQSHRVALSAVGNGCSDRLGMAPAQGPYLDPVHGRALSSGQPSKPRLPRGHRSRCSIRRASRSIRC
jgi:hypothetical protein